MGIGCVVLFVVSEIVIRGVTVCWTVVDVVSEIGNCWDGWAG